MGAAREFAAPRRERAVSPVRLVSFDLDGTLIDTAAEIVTAAREALLDHGLPRLPATEIVVHVGHGSAALMRALHARLADAASPDAAREVDALVASFDRHYAGVIGQDSRAYPGAAAALGRLRSAGIACVCTTNKNAAFAQALLRAHHLEGFFSLLVGGDTLPWRKPDARVLGHVIDLLRVAPEHAAHLGDSVTDLRAARAAGLQAWAVPYGYPGTEPITLAGPDLVFPSLPAAAEHALRSHGRSTHHPLRAASRRTHPEERT